MSDGGRATPWPSLTTAVMLVAALGRCDGRLLRPESDAKRLYDDKLRDSGYNKLIRPVGNTSDTLTVRIGLRLTQIIDVVRIFHRTHQKPSTSILTVLA